MDDQNSIPEQITSTPASTAEKVKGRRIDPKLLPLTRKFTDKEIAEWEKEDKL